MEVIIKQYTLTRFIPVMTASVIPSLMTHWVYGDEVVFDIPMIEMTSMAEFGIAFVMALAIGLLAALFIDLQTSTMVARKGRLVVPILMAGLLMGTAGVVMPELMGMGYDTAREILNGQNFSLLFLVLLVVGKLVLTGLVTGLGIPGGIIGPTLFIGAATGAVFGILGWLLLDIPDVNSSFHALLGMVAMMAATLQAPMVALVTVLELTQNPNVIMPAMFVIVIACLVSGRFFKQRGIFDMQLLKGGYSYGVSPLREQLGSVGVACLMVTEHEHCPESLKPVTAISLQATLFQALEQMETEGHQALPVVTKGLLKDRDRSKFCGVITREHIEAYYLNSLYKKH